MIWKSDFWSLHNALISKSQNAEKSGKLLFSNCFRDLLSENFHIITKRYDLNPNDTSYKRQWIMFFMAMSDGIVSKKVKGYRKITILMTIDPFKWRQNQTWLSKSQIYDINAFHNSLALIWCIMLGFRPFIWNLYGHFQIVSPERTRPKHSLKKIQFCSPAFWPLLLIKALCSDKWSDFQIIVVFL